MEDLRAMQIEEGQQTQEAQDFAGMSRAQRVRAKILAANPKFNNDEIAKKAVDWVLDLMDSDEPEKKKRFGKGKVLLWYYPDSKVLSKILCDNEAFPLGHNLQSAQMLTLFKTIKNLFECEEGFHADLDDGTTQKSTQESTQGIKPAVTLKISVD